VLPAIAELAKEGKVVVREVPTPGNKVMRHFIPMTAANVDALSPQDKEVLDVVTSLICDNFSANEISDVTHDEVWRAAEIGEELPMYTVFARQGEITAEVRRWATDVIENLDARKLAA
jgi:hypothetical protein